MLVNEKGVRFQEKGFHGDNSFFLSPKKRAEITKKDDIFGALFTLCIQYEYTVYSFYCILENKKKPLLVAYHYEPITVRLSVLYIYAIYFTSKSKFETRSEIITIKIN